MAQPHDMPEMQHSSLALAAADDSALVVIDTQTRLNGAMAAACAHEPVENGARLLSAASILGVPVLHTEQYPKGLGPTAPEVVAALPQTRLAFEKTCFSCYAAPGFAEGCRALGRRQMILFGIEAHVCVLQTAFDLRAAGYQVFVVADAVCSRQTINRDNALARMRHAGVIVTNTESVLFEWVGDAQHASFKRIAALMK
jgi:nicotinamidase-related amidase